MRIGRSKTVPAASGRDHIVLGCHLNRQALTSGLHLILSTLVIGIWTSASSLRLSSASKTVEPSLVIPAGVIHNHPEPAHLLPQSIPNHMLSQHIAHRGPLLENLRTSSLIHSFGICVNLCKSVDRSSFAHVPVGAQCLDLGTWSLGLRHCLVIRISPDPQLAFAAF